MSDFEQWAIGKENFILTLHLFTKVPCLLIFRIFSVNDKNKLF